MRLDTSAMGTVPLAPHVPVVFAKDDLAVLFRALQNEGFTIVGPTVRDGAVVLEELTDPQSLPIGVVEEQESGTYRLHQTEEHTYFAFTTGPQSWKKFLFPPEERLWRVERVNGHMVFVDSGEPVPRYAFIGVRACELAAILIQDRVFMQGPIVDTRYRTRREQTFIVAVNCTRAGGTCFCASLGTGPRVKDHYDILLTELDDVFLAEAGSQAGGEILAQVPHRSADDDILAEANHRVEETAHHMGRRVDVDVENVPSLLCATLEHPHWEEIARVCLACGNCTMVCPTCFCFTVEDMTDLTGTYAERVRKWDSCFSQEYSYTAGHSIRHSIEARYRQWLMHKFSYWVRQFGSLGCVGCGRCITWCPAGIDITAELAKLCRDVSTDDAQQKGVGT